MKRRVHDLGLCALSTVALVFAVACDEETSVVDAGTGMDAGSTADAGGADAGGDMCVSLAGECDLLDVDSCGAGMACELFDTGTQCVTVGAGTQGTACDAEGDCAAGFICSSDVGVCSEICCSDEDCGPAAGCSSLAGDELGICIEFDGCDVIEQTGCEDGEGCYYSFSGGGGTFCAPAGTLEVDCRGQGLTACQPGSICFGDMTSSRCIRWCDFEADPNPCEGEGEVCAFAVPEAGVCRVPDLTCDVFAQTGCEASPSSQPVFAQTGCEDGEACYLDGVDSLCSTFVGTTEAGGTCEFTDDCVPGATCITDLDGSPICATFCREETDCTVEGEGCVDVGYPEAYDGLGLCLPDEEP